MRALAYLFVCVWAVWACGCVWCDIVVEVCWCVCLRDCVCVCVCVCAHAHACACVYSLNTLGYDNVCLALLLSPQKHRVSP